MTTATTIRRLNIEARQQQRLKTRIAAWWYTERCKVGTKPLPEGLRELLTLIASDRQDEAQQEGVH